MTSPTAAAGPCPRAVPASPASPARRAVAGLRSRARLVLASSMVVSFLAASNAPSPLYDRYESLWHATPLIGTIAFGVYAFAVLVGLLWLGELASHLGRRPVLLAALAGQVIALALFAVAGSFVPILVGRAVQGLAAGAALGTLSAMMIESDPEAGAVASAASPGAGSGLGAIVSGLVVALLPGPRQTVYLILIAVMALQALGVRRLVAATARRPLSRAALRPRVAVPPRARAAFASTTPIMFAAWAIGGFDAALSPALYGALTGSASVWQSALPLFLLAAAGATATVLLRRASARTLTLTGATTLIAGLGLTVAAIAAGSGGLLLGASAVAGVGFGTGFQGPIRALVPLATAEQRPGLLSAIFLVAYVALGGPAIIAGALVSGVAPLTTVATVLACGLAALTGVALLATLRERR